LEVAPPFLRSMIITALDTYATCGRFTSATSIDRSLCSPARRRRRQMPLGKCAPGARLQIPLKLDNGRLGGKLQNDKERPRPVLGCVPGRTRIVRFESVLDVARLARVVTTRIGVALEHVYEALTDATHAAPRGTDRASSESAAFRRQSDGDHDIVRISACV
jgi:hypothetical protein